MPLAKYSYLIMSNDAKKTFEPRHMHYVRQTMAQTSLRIRAV